MVPVSLPAVVLYFQVLPTATGNGTDAAEPPAAEAGELAEAAALAEAVVLAAAAAEVVAGAVVAPVPAVLDELAELPDDAQPASASTTANRQPAAMADLAAAGGAPDDRRLKDV